MDNPLITQASLLVRIRDSRDGQAWAQFVELYAPLIYDYSRKHGLQDADAADVTQEVLRAVAAAAPEFRYDPRRGSFRGWLYTVIRSKLRNSMAVRIRKGPGHCLTDMEGILEQQPAGEAGPAQQWEREYERRLFYWAAAQVRGEVHESTWQAFWQTAVDGKNADEVARGLGINVANVYLARSRVVARLRARIQQFQGD